MLIAFWKPFRVLTQFNPNENAPDQPTLRDFDLPAGVVPLGRLDFDSEGLLLLTDEPELEARLMHPKARLSKTYWAQIEGDPRERDLQPLRRGGLVIRAKKRDHHCRPAPTRRLPTEPDLPPREPPIRYRAQIPTTWLEIVLSEGKNRQVRRMTAAIGYPTLRLIRVRFADLALADLSLQPGRWTELDETSRQAAGVGPH